MSGLAQRIMFALLCLMCLAGLAVLSWAYTGMARAGEPVAWLVPTVVLVDGTQVQGAFGWYPRQYPSMLRCQAQAKAARFMQPPLGASEIRWSCLPYNPLTGEGA